MNQPVMSGVAALSVPPYIKNQKLINWVADIAALTKPDRIYWCDGSQEEYDRLCGEMVAGGTLIRLGGLPTIGTRRSERSRSIRGSSASHPPAKPSPASAAG